MRGLLRDLRIAARQLRRAPGYTVAAVLALALGIGASTAVFSVVDAVLLRPLAYPDAGRLVMLWASSPAQGDRIPPSYPDFEDWAAQGRDVFAGAAFADGDQLRLRGSEGTEMVIGAFVSPGFFSTLAARPLAGRTFLPGEERAGGDRVVVLGNALWRSRYAGDPSVVGRTITLDDSAYTVVGVMPPGVDFPSWAQLWTPLAGRAASPAMRKRDLRVDHVAIARLAPGVGPARAQRALDVIAARLAAAYPGTNEQWSARLAPMREQVVGGIRPTLLVLGGAVLLLLLIACADVANLALVRATAREREMAVRAALGASRGALVRQLLSESALVAAAGGALGLILAWWGVALLRRFAPPTLPRADEIAIDAGVVGATIIVSAACALLVGLVPAARLRMRALGAALRDGTLGAGTARRTHRLRASLVVAQIALALIVLVGAGLLAASFRRLRAVDPGFDPHGLVVWRILPPPAKYATAAERERLYERITEAARAIPGATAATLVNHAPMSRAGVMSPIGVPGRTAPEGRDAVVFRTTIPGYFRAMGTPILRGRELAPSDMDSSSVTAVVIDQTIAERYWPHEDPIGRPLVLHWQFAGNAHFGQPFTAQVVGVARDVHAFDLTNDPSPTVYVPATHDPWGSMYLLVRGADAAALVSPLRHVVAAIDPDIPVSGITTMPELLARSWSEQQFDSAVVAAFAAAALLLALIGLYGVIAYGVAQRARELGVRLALGAERRDVVALVLREGLALALLGIALGAGGALLATRLLRGLLFGITPTDPLVFGGVALLLAGTALVASWLPARRAARLDPMRVLRAE